MHFCCTWPKPCFFLGRLEHSLLQDYQKDVQNTHFKMEMHHCKVPLFLKLTKQSKFDVRLAFYLLFMRLYDTIMHQTSHHRGGIVSYAISMCLKSTHALNWFLVYVLLWIWKVHLVLTSAVLHMLKCYRCCFCPELQFCRYGFMCSCGVCWCVLYC